MGRRLGGPPEPVWTFKEDGSPFPLPGLDPLDRPARSKLQYRLSYSVWDGNIRASLCEMHLGCEGIDSVRGEDCCERGNEHSVSVKYTV